LQKEITGPQNLNVKRSKKMIKGLEEYSSSIFKKIRAIVKNFVFEKIFKI